MQLQGQDQGRFNYGGRGKVDLGRLGYKESSENLKGYRFGHGEVRRITTWVYEEGMA